MNAFKTNLLKLIDELMILFEDMNPIVYKRLIHYHHLLNNTFEEDNLCSNVMDFISNEKIKDMIKRHNHGFLLGTSFERDFELLWESCTPKNKITIWKWIETIINSLESSVLEH
jgi:hypothetical protein